MKEEGVAGDTFFNISRDMSARDFQCFSFDHYHA